MRMLHSLMGGLGKFNRDTNKIRPLTPSQALSKTSWLFVIDDDSQPLVTILMGHRWWSWWNPHFPYSNDYTQRLNIDYPIFKISPYSLIFKITMLKCSEWVKPSSHVRWFCCRIVGRVTTLAHNPQDYETETFRLSYYNPFRAAEVRHFQQLVESELCKSVFRTSRYKRQRRQGLAQLPNFVSWRLPAVSIEYFINCLSTANFERCFHPRNYFWEHCLVSSAAF